MTRPPRPWLNWRAERARLEPLLARQGGILEVTSSATGPLEEFASVFRSSLDHSAGAKPWRTVQFDPNNSRTRYFDEMLRQVERSLGLMPDTPNQYIFGEGSKLGSEISAGSVTIENSFNFGDDSYSAAVAREMRSKRLADYILEISKREAICFLFVESSSFHSTDLRNFVDLLWSQGLHRLAEGGFLLASFGRAPISDSICWPRADVSIRLGDDYDDRSREHAIEDLANYLLQIARYDNLTHAKAYSTGMLDSHVGPATLYSSLSAALSRTRQ